MESHSGPLGRPPKSFLNNASPFPRLSEWKDGFFPSISGKQEQFIKTMLKPRRKQCGALIVALRMNGTTERSDLVKLGRPTLCCVICCKSNIDNRYKIVLNKISDDAIEY